jgi:putative sterol carrier protein
MADPTVDFFDRVVQQRAGMLSSRVKATVRFDLERVGDGCDHWLVAIDEGTVRVSSEDRPADCTIRADKELFDRIVTGEVDMTTAVLRNQVRVEGDLMLMVVFLSLLPDRPGARDPREFARDRSARHR